VKFLILQKQKLTDRKIFNFGKSETRISVGLERNQRAGTGDIEAYPVAYPPLALSGGGQRAPISAAGRSMRPRPSG
jgi:hypothetical protein